MTFLSGFVLNLVLIFLKYDMTDIKQNERFTLNKKNLDVRRISTLFLVTLHLLDSNLIKKNDWGSYGTTL